MNRLTSGSKMSFPTTVRGSTVESEVAPLLGAWLPAFDEQVDAGLELWLAEPPSPALRTRLALSRQQLPAAVRVYVDALLGAGGCARLLQDDADAGDPVGFPCSPPAPSHPHGLFDFLSCTRPLRRTSGECLLPPPGACPCSLMFPHVPSVPISFLSYYNSSYISLPSILSPFVALLLPEMRISVRLRMCTAHSFSHKIFPQVYFSTR